MIIDIDTEQYMAHLIDMVRTDDIHDSSWKLLECLFTIDFEYALFADRNRAEDGFDLRKDWINENGYSISLTGPCSMLEMMIALALRCEQHIMHDDKFGDRTPDWFWCMIGNLQLGSMMDNNFDEKYVRNICDIFNNRCYQRDGIGCLFTTRNRRIDMRDLDIWNQLLVWLNENFSNDFRF